MKTINVKEKLGSILENKNIHDTYSIDFNRDTFPLNPIELFPSYSSYFLEIGSGWGEFTIESAKRNPETMILAVEMKKKRILHSIKMQKEAELSNIRWMILNVDWFFEELFCEKIFQKIIINFPDPWPKKRHQKHRFMSETFIDDLFKIIVPGGMLEFATDHWSYMESVLKTFDIKRDEWENVNGRMVVKTKIANRPVSFFQKTMQDMKKTPYFLEIKRKG